jgi:putative hemolysin
MSPTVVLTIVAMLLLNGVFAAYELALASVRLDRLRVLAERKRRGAATALRMKNRMEASLAVVQLGITVVGAIAAAAGGASVNEHFAPALKGWLQISRELSNFLALVFFVIPLAAMTIVIGELIPKVFAIKNSEWVCTTLSPLMWAFALVVYPAVLLFEWLTTTFVRLVERLMPRRKTDEQTHLHELRAQVNLLRASQVIGMQEERIILQASRLSSMRVKDIMMPEEDIVMVLADAPLSENLVIAHMDLHTRFPVTVKKGDAQAIIGYVTFKDMVLLAKTHPGNPVIREIIRQIISVPEEMPLSDALRRMTMEHHHLALVRGEGGSVVGMIAQEDIFEELVGDIQDEFDRLPRHISPAGHQLVVGGGVHLGQLREVLKRADLGHDLPATTTVNDWLNHGREEPLRGGDMVVVDRIWAQVRKVRRRRITEATLDPLGSPYEIGAHGREPAQVERTPSQQVGQQVGAGSQETSMPAAQAWGYAFGSDHTLDAMATILNGPWSWKLRDSSRYGDYLSTRSADRCHIRIHDTRNFIATLPAGEGDEKPPFRLTAEIGSPAAAEHDECDRMVRELLTRLNARDVVTCEPID